MTRIGVLAVLCLLSLSWAPAARAQEMSAEEARRGVAAVQEEWRHEPTAAETVRAALRYFEVEPSDLQALRRDARLRGLLPTLGGNYTYRDDRTASFEAITPTPQNTDLSGEVVINTIGAGIQWDPRDLVFHPDQVNIYGLIGVQRDLMLEVLRAYFARRQLAMTIMLRPPEDPIAMASLVLRVEEFTAVLDMMTGEWFSQSLAQRRQNR
jgi:hypothetical protein